jgi:hypothetical protein
MSPDRSKVDTIEGVVINRGGCPDARPDSTRIHDLRQTKVRVVVEFRIPTSDSAD